MRRHLENNLRWIGLIHAERSRFKQGIQGLVLTGWQRYDHFAVLCELLPVAIPSLALSLSSASKGYFEVDVKENNLLSVLTCPEPPQGLVHTHLSATINYQIDTYFILLLSHLAKLCRGHG